MRYTLQARVDLIRSGAGFQRHKAVFIQRTDTFLRNGSSKEKLTTQKLHEEKWNLHSQYDTNPQREVYVVQSSANEQRKLPLLVLYRVSAGEVRGADLVKHACAHHTMHTVQNNRTGFTFHQLLLNSSTSRDVSSLFWKMHICKIK